jgi:hypothetical protein
LRGCASAEPERAMSASSHDHCRLIAAAFLSL